MTLIIKYYIYLNISSDLNNLGFGGLSSFKVTKHHKEILLPPNVERNVLFELFEKTFYK